MSDSDDALMTILVLEPIGIPIFSSRGITQTLDVITAAQQMRRTVNGRLLDLSAPQFRKYHSTLSCSDQAPPAFDDVWPGLTLQVDCIERLSYKTGGVPARAVVPGSETVEGGFTTYRPRLEMKISNFSIQEDEWGAVVGWNMDLEEV